MKRTAEIIFAIIGAVLYLITFVLSILMLGLKNSPSFEQGVNEAIKKDPALSDANVTFESISKIVQTFSTFVAISAFIGLVLGILAIIFLKGNKKPKAAGILLIAGGVVTTVGSIGFSFFGGVAYLIAGIIALVRKPKVSLTEEYAGKETF
ncbi:DUF4064 domain-containing protein [Metabacillus sp. RGM 3146]|uniref:DUF4064 domain-containing protein n=1 Tax=Metabacillus sp. RGM 3146 TaxID=3401092 RepID=UPI003B98F1DA